MQRSLRCCAVVLLLLVGLTTTGIVGPAVGLNAQGEPDLTTSVTEREVTPGSETTLSIQLTNDGTFIDGDPGDRSVVTTARGVVVDARTPEVPITVQSGPVALGEVSESATSTADFDIAVPESADPGRYEITVDLDYSYTYKAINTGSKFINEERSRSETAEVTIRVTDDARFEVTEVDSNLRVGEEGEITGELENIGNDDARNAEISFAPNSETVVALESNVAVGDIEAGETTQFSIPVEVTSEAEAVPKRFDLPVSFRDENGISQSDNDTEFLVDIGGQRDAFLVEPVNNSIPAGGSQPLDLRVTNNLDEPVTDIEGKLFADDPLSSTNDETFTESLDSGETTTVTVDLSASSSATIKDYPTSMDFRYVDSDGDSKLSDPYRMAISVTEPEENGGSPLPLVIGLLVVAGGVALLWRRGTFDDIEIPGR